MVGSQSASVAHTYRSVILHPEWVLHVLGKLCVNDRRHDIHSTGSGPTGGFRPFLVGNLSGELGEI